jgi:iron(III) transport system substrate-binding protein
MAGTATTLLVAACAPTTPSVAPPAPPRSLSPAASPAPSVAAQVSPVVTAPGAEWEALLADARREGSVSVVTSPGDNYRQALGVFSATYGIGLELLPGQGGGDFVPRIQTERQAGQYLWDVLVTSVQPVFVLMEHVDPLGPELVLPEVTGDSYWQGGFSDGYEDTAQSSVYAFSRRLSWNVVVNRSIVPESELSKLDDLWDPRWKGKIALSDSRVLSAGAGSLAAFLVVKGEDRVKSFLADQQPVLTADARQLAEWVIRGQYPIGIAVSPGALSQFSGQGVDLAAIQPLDPVDPAAAYYSVGGGIIAVLNRQPHPAAAKVFVNWFMSKAGQEPYAQKTGYNSRRLDVAVVDPSSAIEPGAPYTVDNGKQDFLPTVQRVVEISKQILQ